MVTGGGSGIGKMIAAALVANGAKVYIAARKEAQLKAVRLSFLLLWFEFLIIIILIFLGFGRAE